MKKEELFQLTESMTQDERAYFLTLTIIEKLIFTFIVIISWTTSSIMKYIMYKHIGQMKTYERPITVLIVMGQVVDLIVHSFIVANFFMILLSGAGPVEFINTYFQLNVSAYKYCWTYCYVTFFWIAYASYSGFGIALTRFLNICGVTYSCLLVCAEKK
jgi:hypothetical protein